MFLCCRDLSLILKFLPDILTLHTQCAVLQHLMPLFLSLCLSIFWGLAFIFVKGDSFTWGGYHIKKGEVKGPGDGSRVYAWNSNCDIGLAHSDKLYKTLKLILMVVWFYLIEPCQYLSSLSFLPSSVEIQKGFFFVSFIMWYTHGFSDGITAMVSQYFQFYYFSDCFFWTFLHLNMM